jgi:hypothetical protein
MKATQGWGWLTVGVMALGLNGFYHDGGLVWAHRVADQVAAVAAGQPATLADLASAGVDRIAERANMASTRGEATSCRVAAVMARLQAKQARLECKRVAMWNARFEPAMRARPLVARECAYRLRRR